MRIMLLCPKATTVFGGSIFQAIIGLLKGHPDPLKKEWEVFFKAIAASKKGAILILAPLPMIRLLVKLGLVTFFAKLIRCDVVVLPHLEISGERKHVHYVTVMQMIFPKLFTVSNRGWGTSGSVRQGTEKPTASLEYVSNMVSGRRTKIPNAEIHEEATDQQRLCKGSKVNLVVLQMPTDHTILYKSPISWEEFFLHIIDIAAIEKDQNFVFRPHPLHADFEKVLNERMPEILDRAPNISVSAGRSLYDDFELINFVITINSGVGLEALLNGIPVMTFGDSIYKNFTATMPCLLSKAQIEAKLRAQEFERQKSAFISNNLFTADDTSLVVKIMQDEFGFARGAK